MLLSCIPTGSAQDFAQAMPASYAATDETRRFVQDTFVFDCLQLFYTLEDKWAERCLAAGVNAANVTIGAENDWDDMVRRIDQGLETIARSPFLMLATCRADIDEARARGKLAVIMGTQGSSMIDAGFHNLRLMAKLGLRYVGLAYTGATLFADGCGEKRDAGLSYLGEELVDAVNELPLILDLSHAGHRARAEGAARARHPVCTHSNADALNRNGRNTTDDTARAIVAKGGMMGICGLPRSVWPENPTLDHLLDHCDHWMRVCGPDRVGIGLDLTEGYKAAKTLPAASTRWRTLRPDIFGTVEEFHTQEYPEGMRTILDLPNLAQGLFDRQHDRQKVAGVLGQNWLDHFTRCIG